MSFLSSLSFMDPTSISPMIVKMQLMHCQSLSSTTLIIILGDFNSYKAEVCDIVEEAVIKTIPKKKKWKKAKQLSKEALQIAEKREAKDKREKERYTYLNAEFQRIARRDQKPFLSDQCKEIEENDRMGKTRDLFKKIRDIKVTFHAKMGSIKDRNGRDLTEAEDIKKKWQEYTEELYKKDLHDPDHTYLEPDILECEVK